MRLTFEKDVFYDVFGKFLKDKETYVEPNKLVEEYACKITDFNSENEEIDIGAYDPCICSRFNVFYEKILNNIKTSESLKDLDSKEINVMYTGNSFMEIYNNIKNGSCSYFLFNNDGIYCADSMKVLRDFNTKPMNVTNWKIKRCKYAIIRNDIKDFILGNEKAERLQLTNENGNIVECSTNDCFSDPLFSLVKEKCVLTEYWDCNLDILDTDFFCFGNTIDELLQNINERNFVSKYINTNYKYCIWLNELNEYLEEAIKMPEDNNLSVDDNCGLTVRELWELMDDIAIRNVTFDDSGVHLENVLDMIDRYKRN